MVSSAGVTGAKNSFGNTQQTYFDRISAMNLKAPQVIGFGISNAETFQMATSKAKGAIIGSAFVKHLTEKGVKSISKFISKIR